VVVSLEIGSLTALPLRLVSVSSPLSSSLGVPLLAATTGPAAAPFVAYSPARPFAGEEHPPGMPAPSLSFCCARRRTPNPNKTILYSDPNSVTINYLLTSISFAKIIGCTWVHACPMLDASLILTLLKRAD